MFIDRRGPTQVVLPNIFLECGCWLIWGRLLIWSYHYLLIFVQRNLHQIPTFVQLNFHCLFLDDEIQSHHISQLWLLKIVNPTYTSSVLKTNSFESTWSQTTSFTIPSGKHSYGKWPSLINKSNYRWAIFKFANCGKYLSGTSSWQHPRLGRRRHRSKHRHRPEPGLEICQGENKVWCLEDTVFFCFFFFAWKIYGSIFRGVFRDFFRHFLTCFFL